MENMRNAKRPLIEEKQEEGDDYFQIPDPPVVSNKIAIQRIFHLSVFTIIGMLFHPCYIYTSVILMG